MSLLDEVLHVFGTNRVRVRWKWEGLRKRWAERGRVVPKVYEHKACPRCGSIVDKTERVCPICGAPQRGPRWDKVRRLTRMFVPEGVFTGTGIVFAINFAVFAGMVAIGGAGALGVPDTELLERFGAWTVGAVHAGDWWRLVTANFVHIGALHILMNSMALAQVAPIVEAAYGRHRFMALYVLSGVGGMATSYAYRHWSGQNPIVAGASASIFGMIGAAAAYFFLAGRRDLGGIFVRWAVTALVLSFLIPADNVAHAGGLVSGALGAVVLGRGRTPGRVGARLWTAVEVLVLVGVAASFSLAWSARPEQWRLRAVVEQLREQGLCDGGDCRRIQGRMETCMQEEKVELGPSLTEEKWQRLWMCVEKKP